MLRWCDLVLRLSAPIVPDDIRRDWLREWRAEFAYASARAASNGRRMPISVTGPRLRRNRSCRLAAVESVESGNDHPGHQARASIVETQAQLHGGRGVDAGDWYRRHHGDLRRGQCGVAAPAAVSAGRSTRQGLQDRLSRTPIASAAPSRRRISRTGGATTASSPSSRRSISGSLALTGVGAAEQMPAGFVTGGFFNVMGTRAALGRGPQHVGRSDGRPRCRRPQRRLLAAAFWSECRNSRSAGGTRRRVVRSDWRHAARISVSAAIRDVGAAALFRQGSRDAARCALHRRRRTVEAGRAARARPRGHARDCGPAGAAISREPTATSRQPCIRCANRWSAASGSRCSCCSARSASCC